MNSRRLSSLYFATTLSLLVSLAPTGCSDDSSPAGPDAALPADAGADVGADLAADARVPDLEADLGAPADAAGVPLPGFGSLSGACGVLDSTEWSAQTSPFYFRNAIDFGSAAFDETKLTTGGKKVYGDGNLGGDSLHSEVFAYEVLYRCELATLLKTEREIVYINPNGKKTDLLLEIDGRKIGVSVTRARRYYPPGEPYTEPEATALLQKKLDGVLASAANASAGDAWERSILYVLAFDGQTADVLKTAYGKLSGSTQANTILMVTVTEGKDDYIYN